MKASQLRAAGRRLFGDEWKTALGRAIGYGYIAILRMSKGDVTVNKTAEMAVAGVEAIEEGFRPSWWSDDDIRAFNVNGHTAPEKPKRARRALAIMVGGPK